MSLLRSASIAIKMMMAYWSISDVVICVYGRSAQKVTAKCHGKHGLHCFAEINAARQGSESN